VTAASVTAKDAKGLAEERKGFCFGWINLQTAPKQWQIKTVKSEMENGFLCAKSAMSS
jgi:hypothetical protein